MEDHPINDLLKCTIENLREMMDVSTVIGDPIVTGDGSTILPISKVSLGFGSGGGEYSTKHCPEYKEKVHSMPFGGGSGAGVSIKPVGFLIVRGDKFRLMPLEFNDSVEKLIDTVPDILDFIKKTFNKDKSATESTKNTKEE
ncbi:GerW family sporulation protein [Clostridium cellulovorans]|uniref:Sporulation protein YtfJ n=1 Tax=Clostridium cellulovorans (strain ATCC 35296 / DSM 3052 / OCM 3 / 743B) TaxID=573061 RepID=D9SM58_CLOC7|nr:GerW family sporulation protein [Clostridium cellulovorans]ADL51789.1 sporulation protein YtfJ [Clostridium cellulovorans 743B]